MKTAPQLCIAFSEAKKIAAGPLTEVAVKVKKHLEKHPKAPVLIFDQVTSAPVEVDFRGSVEAVLQRLSAREEAAGKGATSGGGPGRPKLGVVSREISLLPRHWEWLALQPGGASATLRKLVEEAKKKNRGQDQIRQAQEATYRFMNTMAGDLAHYEEALRAFYAKKRSLFETLVAPWPKDIKEHLLSLAEGAFGEEKT